MKVSMKKSGLIIFLGFTLLLGNSYARRVKESLLYAPTFYQEQFNYLGYSKNKAIERTLKKIAQELGIGNVDEWVQQHLSSLKAKIDVSSISFEKIRSRVYQGLETLGVDLTELYEKWKEEAQNAITECRDSNNISSCVQNKLSFKRWQTEVKKEGSYLIFKCQTKNYFFFNDSGEKFEPITLDFAMAII